MTSTIIGKTTDELCICQHEMRMIIILILEKQVEY